MGDSTAAPDVDDGGTGVGTRSRPRVIAVDGSAASGKSTTGRALAAALDYAFLDTGIMYRAVTLASLDRGIDAGDDQALAKLASTLDLEVSLPHPGDREDSTVHLDGVDVTDALRQRRVEEAVSLVSRVSGVRDALVRRQRELAGREPVVMAGRDIGTVVLPDADLKIYLDASPEERARRRYQEFASQGRDVSEGMVLEDLRRRDRIDKEREASPLRPAEDAIVIDTDGLSQEDVLARVLVLVDGAG